MEFGKCVNPGFLTPESHLVGIYQHTTWIGSKLSLLCQLPCSSDGKETVSIAGDLGSVPELGRFFGEENDNPLQYSCLEGPMDRRAWRATVCGITKSPT